MDLTVNKKPCKGYINLHNKRQTKTVSSKNVCDVFILAKMLLFYHHWVDTCASELLVPKDTSGGKKNKSGAFQQIKYLR